MKKTLNLTIAATRSAVCWAHAHASPEDLLDRVQDELGYLATLPDCDLTECFVAVMPWTRDREAFRRQLDAAAQDPETLKEPLFKLTSDGETVLCDTAHFIEKGRTKNGVPIMMPVGDEDEDLTDDENVEA